MASKAILILHLQALLHRKEHLVENLHKKAFFGQGMSKEIFGPRNVRDLVGVEARSKVEEIGK